MWDQILKGIPEIVRILEEETRNAAPEVRLAAGFISGAALEAERNLKQHIAEMKGH